MTVSSQFFLHTVMSSVLDTETYMPIGSHLLVFVHYYSVLLLVLGKLSFMKLQVKN